MNSRKKQEADLRNYHTIFLQTGLVLSLLIFIIATKIDLTAGEPETHVVNEQEVIEMQDVIRTEQIDVVEPPPVQPSPVEVPDDEVIDDIDLNISADLDFGSMLDLPPPPDQDKIVEDEIFYASEIEPTLIGGRAELESKIDYPERPRRANLDGRVYLNFIVDEEGNVIQPEVVSTPHPDLGEEALRVIKEARFTPGLQQGRPVKVRMGMYIQFRLAN